MLIGDLVAVSGYVLGAFAFGYVASWLPYLFRRVFWQIT